MPKYEGYNIIQKGKMTYPKEQSAGLAPRGKPAKGKKTYKSEQSAFLASRGEPEKKKVTYKEGRYK